ncbi:MAG: fibrillarin-like rRNA/tRNA 2'-O-methyltransferase [Nanoarchaeota archaeon]
MKPVRHDNVFLDRRKLCTVNRIPGTEVYGERLVSEKGIEYRHWDPKRSKLGAALAKNMKIPKLKKDDVWLYLGAASGTTVSHVSDIVEEGFVFALDFAPRVVRDLYFLGRERKNIAPLLGDANKMRSFESLVSGTDILFQDIAQREQVDIFLKNLRFLKRGGIALLSCKSRSIDVTKKPKMIFRQVEKKLAERLEILDWRTLEPFEQDHAFFVCKLR